METVTEIWKKYERGVAKHRETALDAETEKAYRFYEGDQWYGLESGEPLPCYNFIRPTVKFKVASVAMNRMSISFSCRDAKYGAAIEALNRRAAEWWENLKMDTLLWDVLEASAVAGDAYLYFYDARGGVQAVDNTRLFLGDETTGDLARQPYLMIYERRRIEDVKQIALTHGAPEETAERILPDRDERGEKDGKCGVILYMELRDDGLHFSRSARQAVIQPDTCIRGMKRYPVAGLITAPRRGSARGRGEVLPLIQNQIEVNRNLVRRLLNAKMTAFSRLVYAADKIDNPEDLGKVGTAIAVGDTTIEDVRDAVGYVTPSPMSGDAKIISDEMLSVSRELAGTGNAVTGQIDPSQTSGSAIIAVRDQAQLPLTETTARLRRFVEDIALIWLDLWTCYAPRGCFEGIPADALRRMRPRVRIDATDTAPFSKYARQQALEGLLEKGQITFEEFVGALEDDGSYPKAKLTEILQNRKGEVTDGQTGKQ